jgi:hypothetical protein
VSVIVIEFITLDGIVSDPDGSGGTPAGGWAFRHGPETVSEDPFRLGSTLDEGVLLLGRATWQLFSRISPPAYLECLSAEQAGAVVLARYRRAR